MVVGSLGNEKQLFQWILGLNEQCHDPSDQAEYQCACSQNLSDMPVFDASMWLAFRTPWTI